MAAFVGSVTTPVSVAVLVCPFATEPIVKNMPVTAAMNNRLLVCITSPLQRHGLLIPNPDRTGPGQLAILLLESHVIPMRTQSRIEILKFQIPLLLVGRKLVNILSVANQLNRCDRTGSTELHPDRTSGPGAEVFAHEAIAQP